MPRPWGFPLYITTATNNKKHRKRGKPDHKLNSFSPTLEKRENQTSKLNLRSHFGIKPVVIIMFRNFNKIEEWFHVHGP
jgi:hypothetical protein